MSYYMDGRAQRMLKYGNKVERATGTLPATGQAAIFNILVGRIMLTNIVGEVTIVIQNQACNLSLVTNPTVGTDVAICAVLNIQADEVGCLYGITGLFTDALVGANAGATVVPRNPVVMNVGTLDWLTSATNSGSIKWTLFYIPVDDGAYVTAA